MKLDLETLKFIKYSFKLHSDHSTKCNGYNSLCRLIEKSESEVNENCNIPDVSACLLEYCNRVEVIDNTGRAYVNWKNTMNVKMEMQDNNRTLKIFIT